MRRGPARAARQERQSQLKAVSKRYASLTPAFSNWVSMTGSACRDERVPSGITLAGYLNMKRSHNAGSKIPSR